MIANLLQIESIRPVIGRTFPFAEAKEALAYLQTGRAKGKVVVRIWRRSRSGESRFDRSNFNTGQTFQTYVGQFVSLHDPKMPNCRMKFATNVLQDDGSEMLYPRFNGESDPVHEGFR